jgi:glycosyltransferase involved in cell wall biosynthesis
VANSSTAGQRPRVAVAITYPVDPPLGGGQVRALNLYRGLSRAFDVELVTLDAPGGREQRRQLSPGLWEHRVPKSLEHAERERELELEAGTVVTDVAMPELYRHTPAFLAALRGATADAHAGVACHPYTFPAIREVTEIPVWYEAQDVEASLKQHVLGDNKVAQRLLAGAEAVERACCTDADLIWACSTEDATELVQRYGGDPDRVLVVPNGADVDGVEYVAPVARREHQRRLRMLDGLLGIFIASWHEPNVVGARELLRLAERVPEGNFLIVGSVGMALASEARPDNVAVTGTVSAGFKQSVLAVADVALNPVTTGSGTNLKMLEYFAAGIPVISTEFGARGLGVRAGEHYVQAEPSEMEAALMSLRAGDPGDVERLVTAARKHVETRLSWTTITDELLTRLAPAVGVSRSA